MDGKKVLALLAQLGGEQSEPRRFSRGIDHFQGRPMQHERQNEERERQGGRTAFLALKPESETPNGVCAQGRILDDLELVQRGCPRR
jgi:hypothetical protein